MWPSLATWVTFTAFSFLHHGGMYHAVHFRGANEGYGILISFYYLGAGRLLKFAFLVWIAWSAGIATCLLLMVTSFLATTALWIITPDSAVWKMSLVGLPGLPVLAALAVWSL